MVARGGLCQNPRLNGDAVLLSANFRDGPHPFETLKPCGHADDLLDEAQVALVPKRTDMFAPRSSSATMGKATQNGATGAGYYVAARPRLPRKRRMLGRCFLLAKMAPGNWRCRCRARPQTLPPRSKAVPAYFPRRGMPVWHFGGVRLDVVIP